MNKTAFITGISGFVGDAVARELLQAGYHVKALVRPSSDLSRVQDLPIEFCEGELRDKSSLQKATKHCDEVYHVAAQYSFYNPNPNEIYASNVSGTRNLLEACLQNNIGKIVYTSTVGAIGIPKDGSPGSELSPITLEDCRGHYKRSKFLAELEAQKFAKQGLPVIIVNPSAPIGVRDAKPTPTGQMILDFLNRKMPAYLDTGLNLIDVEDVAKGHLLAAQFGKPGERYILGNQNLHLKEIFDLLAEITGLPSPKIQVPYALALGTAYVSELWAKISKGKPHVSVEAVWLGKKRMFFDNSKALQELKLPQTDIKLALTKAVQWFQDNNYVKK